MKKFVLIITLFFCCLSAAYSQIPELWGMTTFGGASNSGSIFKINADGTGFNSLYSFDANSGYVPRGSLCLAPNGKLYGTTNGGGSQSVGTLFCFNPSGNIFTKIVDFNYTNGAYPWGSFTLASDGFLYSTSYGGTGGNGNIYRVNPATNAFSVLYNLASGDGASPGGIMVQAANGLLYGMTAYGGAGSGGTIFSFNPTGNVFDNVFDFNTINGKTGYGSLLEASDGNLYGMTRNGGAYGVGVLFRFNPTTNIYTSLVDFDTTNGKWPWNGVMQVSGTKLYGMTCNGGTFNQGVVFSYDFTTGIYTTEHSFDFTHGGVPFGGLMQASDNFLYGMTFNGGDSLAGTTFRYDPVADTLIVIHSFYSAEGSNPSGNLIELSQPSTIHEMADDGWFHIYPNPSNGLITIKGVSPGTDAIHLTITDAMGQIIMEKTIHTTYDSFTTTADISTHPSGMYFWYLNNTAGFLKTGKLIVNGK